LNLQTLVILLKHTDWSLIEELLVESVVK
jgi:hypothetical protein